MALDQFALLELLDALKAVPGPWLARLPEFGFRAAPRQSTAQPTRWRSPEGREKETILKEADFRIDLQSRQVQVCGKEIHLTPKEFDVLVYLMRNAGKVLTHHTVLGAVWGGNSVDQAEYLRVFILRLRKKIEKDPARPRYILTEPWVGYRFLPGK